MPYQYNPYTNSYEWYEQGQPPPPRTNSGDDFIPGWGDYYTERFGGGGSNSNQNSSGGNSGGSGGNSSGGGADGLDPAKRDAYSYLLKLFESYGLGSLAPKILEYVQQGYGADTITLLLQDTSEYKERFKANEARRKNNLSILTPAEYLALERSYRQILEANGLPKGFYDSTDDFANWIGNDVAPAEIQERAQEAARAVSNSDDHYISALRDYGLGQGDLVAAMLDRNRALPLLQKTVRMAEIGAEARRQGLQLSQQRADLFESMGVSQEGAAEAYQTIGEALPTLDLLGDIYRQDYGQTDIEDELLGRNALASQKRKRLTTREVGSFSGSSAIGNQSLAGKSRGEF